MYAQINISTSRLTGWEGVQAGEFLISNINKKNIEKGG